ncbi:PilW family protein [Halomonas sp. LES1]|nr:PilW family protein [Halomonas sp. LES1]MDT0513434.1 PilW family protein [Halomonas sp. LES1]
MRQRGVSLVELMISLVLGLLVIALAVQMLLGTRASMSTQDAMSYLQESARYVSFRLQPLLRNVGYAGCANANKLSTSDSVIGTYDLQTPLGGSQDTNRGLSYWQLTFLQADKVTEVALASPMSSPAGVIRFSKQDAALFDTASGEKTALVTDCDTTDVFVVDKNDDESVEPKDSLSKAYGAQQSAISSLYVLKAWRLVLDDQAGTGERALFLDRTADITGNGVGGREELVAGVTGFDVTFSLDTDNDGQIDRLKVPAEDIDTCAECDWDNVRRIEIALTLSTQPGVVPGGDDNGRLERTFNLTFTPRNLQFREGA